MLAGLSGGYHFRLANLPSGLGQGVYLGADVDAANVWDTTSEVSASDLLYGVTLLLGADTLVGPVFLGYGFFRYAGPMRIQTACGLGLLLLCGCFPGVHLDPTVTKTTPAAYTTTTVSCGGNTFTLSTGTSAGRCTITYGSDGRAMSAQCKDGSNAASVDCARNQGQGGCGAETTGSASCRN